MKSTVILCLFVLFSFGWSQMQPVKNFNISYLARGGVAWWLESVYDSEGNKWYDDFCGTMAFRQGPNGNMIVNSSHVLDSRQNNIIHIETNLYYDEKNPSIFYLDENLTEVAFFVANFTTIWQVQNVSVYGIILAQNDTKTGRIVTYGLMSSYIWTYGYYDLRDWLRSYGLNPIDNKNYFSLSALCIYANIPVSLFKKPTQILGDWNVLAVYDVEDKFKWNTTSCVKFHFTPGEDNLYDMYMSIGKTQYGPWWLVSDPSDPAVFFGFWLGDYKTLETTLQVIYADVIGNLIIASEELCYLAYISPKETKISTPELAIFNTYIKKYALGSCHYFEDGNVAVIDNTKC